MMAMDRGSQVDGQGETQAGRAADAPKQSTVANPLVVAAHELKTPLVLMHQLSLELLDGAGATDDFAKTLAQRIRLTSERSLRLVDSLTRAARLEDGLFAMEPVYLDNVVGEVVAEISPLAQSLGQKITVKKSRQTRLVIANRTLLRALVLNIVDNSLQYNNCGQNIEISARLARPRAANSRFVALEIRDFGATLSLCDFRRLRDNLGRAQPLADRPLSSGLGLAIAEIFAKKMNGSLDVVRHQCGGLTFAVTLPISRQTTLWDLS